jgi:hypothetical protein
LCLIPINGTKFPEHIIEEGAQVGFFFAVEVRHLTALTPRCARATMVTSSGLRCEDPLPSVNLLGDGGPKNSVHNLLLPLKPPPPDHDPDAPAHDNTPGAHAAPGHVAVAVVSPPIHLPYLHPFQQARRGRRTLIGTGRHHCFSWPCAASSWSSKNLMGS